MTIFKKQGYFTTLSSTHINGYDYYELDCILTAGSEDSDGNFLTHDILAECKMRYRNDKVRHLTCEFFDSFNNRMMSSIVESDDISFVQEVESLVKRSGNIF